MVSLHTTIAPFSRKSWPCPVDDVLTSITAGTRAALTAAESVLIDLLKVIASQLIVWHHLVSYGPVARAAASAWPGLTAWLAGPAKLAVQVFLVLGGYLAARSLWPGSGMRVRAHALPGLLSRRWWRLARPYVWALLVAMLASALARQWGLEEDTPAAPSWGQWWAHVLMLQDVLGVEALSTGVWYVAVDLQLYAGLACGLCLCRRGGDALAAALGLLLTVTSLWWWNLDAGLDAWAPYFAGSYLLGALAWRAVAGHRRLAWSATLLAVVGVALLLEWRSRVALAAVVAAALVWCPWLAARCSGGRTVGPRRLRGGLAALSRTSFALFLLHYPVSLVINAPLQTWGAADGMLAWLILLLSWACSMWASWLFDRWLEASPALSARSGRVMPTSP